MLKLFSIIPPLLIPQVTHRNVPGDFRSYPCDRGNTAGCSAPLWSSSESSFPGLGLEPRFPSPPAAMGRAGQHWDITALLHPSDCTHTEWLLLLRVTIQASLHGFVWCFCLEFPTDTKKSLHLAPFWRLLLHCDSPWHSSVTHHQPELCISQPCSSQNRSEQPDARKRIMKLFCHICTGRLKADKLLSSWKWVLQQGEDWKRLGRHQQSWRLSRLADYLLSPSFLHTIPATWPEIRAGEPKIKYNSIFQTKVFLQYAADRIFGKENQTKKSYPSKPR